MDPVNGGNQSDPGLIGTGRGHNILIVDDIAENIEVLGTILALDGYKIGIARKGMEALMRARTGMYDLILLDIIMPEMDGFEVCRRLKSDSFTREIPIIFLSARIDKVSIVRGLEAGGQDYVTKPFNAHELLARIKTHIELREKTMALEVLNKSLEARVEERTAELIRAHKKLSLLEKAKSDFLAIISHEIRTPLNAVVNLIQLLQEMAVSEEQQEFIADLKMSVDRLARFSEAALLVTSFKVSRPGLARKRMPIATLFAICVNECAQRLEAKKITMTTSVNPGTITVAADPGLIKKCLHHILLNSIKYVHEGGFISLNAVAAGTEIVITIADDGPGLSENARSFLYELFSSGDIQHHSEGFGLGLATARMIMEAHGGSIEVREGEKGGVLVTLTLPSFDDTACDALQG